MAPLSSSLARFSLPHSWTLLAGSLIRHLRAPVALALDIGFSDFCDSGGLPQSLLALALALLISFIPVQLRFAIWGLQWLCTRLHSQHIFALASLISFVPVQLWFAIRGLQWSQACSESWGVDSASPFSGLNVCLTVLKSNPLHRAALAHVSLVRFAPLRLDIQPCHSALPFNLELGRLNVQLKEVRICRGRKSASCIV